MLPSVALGGVAVLLLIGFAIGIHNERRHIDRVERQRNFQAEMLAASVRTALEFEDVPVASANVAALAANPEVEAAAVYDAAGNPVAFYSRVRRSVPAAAPQAADKGSAIAAVESEGRRIGTIYVRGGGEELAARLARHGGLALLLLMGALLMAVAGASQRALKRGNADLAASNARLREEIAERTRAEEALRQAQKMQAVGQLTGGLAHDFNNLLTPIIGGLDYLVMTITEPRLQGIAKNALEAARRGAKLTTQLLAFSRTHRLNIAAVAINPAISRMQGLLAHTIGAAVTVRLDLAPDAGAALCDDNQIENAILNLAINARDAMPDGGTLTISTRRATLAEQELPAGAYVEIAIADTGSGMTPEVLARATEPFFTTKPAGQGTGLGLAQVYGVAQQFGGTVRIDSRVGEGTTVRILLPAAEGDEQAAAAPTAPRIVAGADASILIVDDDDDVRTFVETSLTALGYRTSVATCGPEAMEQLAAARPDLVLLDYAMPGMNGAEVARAARRAAPEIPIVFVTGHADAEAIEEALGADAPVLHKPFVAADLAAIIQRHLPARTPAS